MSAKKTKVAPIPRGYRSLTPHILVSDVAGAVALYQTALGATEVAIETLPESDVPVFAQIRIGNSGLTLGLGEGFGVGNIYLHHYVEDFDAAWTGALAAGFVEMEAPKETYWGDRMGLLVDPLGVRWSIAKRVVRLTPEERQERATTMIGSQPVIADF